MGTWTFVSNLLSQTGRGEKWALAQIIDQLVNAARDDDLPKFIRIASRRVNWNAQEKGFEGATPLIAAALSGGSKVFFYLLAAGAKVDARGRDGSTALMAAVMLGDANLQKIEALIAAGADVNARNNAGSSVLRYAKWAAGGHVATKTINLLQQHGAKE